MKSKISRITWSLALALIMPVAMASTASAGPEGQQGRSPIYQLDVTYQGNVIGKVTVNTVNAELPS